MQEQFKGIDLFQQYVFEAKTLIKENGGSNRAIKRNIINLGLDSDFVDANVKYFKEQYEAGYTPDNVLEQIETDIDELYLKIKDLDDDYVIDVVNDRRLGKYCINDIDTDDLEMELESRFDSSYRDINSLSRDELLEELGLNESDIIDHDKSLIYVICRALGFNNGFAYTKEEIIEELKKRI